VTGPRGCTVRLFNRYLPRVHAAAARDPVVATAFLRVTGLLDPPTALLRPGRLARVLLGTHQNVLRPDRRSTAPPHQLKENPPCPSH
jgi:hypothetical protein